MIKEIVTELACDIEGRQTCYATITSFGVVSVWDINSGGRLKSFKADYDFGGSRFLYFGHSNIIVTASYAESSISAYDLASVERIWMKAGIDVDRLIPDCVDGFYVNSSRISQIDVKSGRYSSFSHEGKALACTSGGTLLARNKEQYILFHKAQFIGAFPAYSFDTLTSAFGGGYIVVSEPGSGSRIISERTLECVAKVPDLIFHSIKYSVKHQVFFGVAVMAGKGVVLLKLYPSGETTCIGKLSSSIADFSLNGEFLITAKKEIINLK